MRIRREHFTFLLVPLLLASYPAIFLYHQNAQILTLSSLRVPLAICLAICVVAYTVLLLSSPRSPIGAANATLVLLAAFFLYGPTYDWLRQMDLVSVDHATLLPGMILAAIYGARRIRKLSDMSARSLWGGAAVALGVLFAINAVGIVATEVKKAEIAQHSQPPAALSASTGQNRAFPDIYYIVMDEFAGLDVARAYWGYSGIDTFQYYLESNGFYVASGSRSRTNDTLVEMASRLNYEPFGVGEDPVFYFQAISRNRAMRLFRMRGYKTVVLGGTGGPFAYPGQPPIQADFIFDNENASTTVSAAWLDEFGASVLDLTMLRTMSKLYRGQFAPYIASIGNNILYIFEKTADLEEIPSPKFVYAHIMLPHFPFIFDSEGNINNPDNLWDWNYYFGSYIFATQKVSHLVGSLLENADPANPPIIILQSDHGARNQRTASPNSVVLQDYPEEYQYHILNALYLPGFDYSELERDMDPLDTFPIILNYYLGEDIPLR